MIVDTVKESEEDRRRVRIANLAKQGASTRKKAKSERNYQHARGEIQVFGQVSV